MQQIIYFCVPLAPRYSDATANNSFQNHPQSSGLPKKTHYASDVQYSSVLRVVKIRRNS